MEITLTWTGFFVVLGMWKAMELLGKVIFKGILDVGD